MKLISPLSLLIHRHIIKNADMAAYLMLIKLPLRMTLEKQRTSSTRMLQLALSEYRCYSTFRHAPRPRATPAGSSVLGVDHLAGTDAWSSARTRAGEQGRRFGGLRTRERRVRATGRGLRRHTGTGYGAATCIVARGDRADRVIDCSAVMSTATFRRRSTHGHGDGPPPCMGSKLIQVRSAGPGCWAYEIFFY